MRLGPRNTLLKRSLPQGLFWRSVLIVVAPMLILQAVVGYLIVKRHYDGVTRQMTEAVALEIAYVVNRIDETEDRDAAVAELAQASRILRFPLSLSDTATLRPASDAMFFDVVGRAIEEEMRSRFDRSIAVRFDRDAKQIALRAPTRHGTVEAVLPQRRLVASNPHLLWTWMLGAAAPLIAVALLYLRNQVRPIRALADAADAFGKGRSTPLTISGAEEVRRATAAFLDMRERIERQIEQRTRMLSGVSHDMRTPLTRMKLALEMMEDSPELRELRRDVADLERILEEFLAYARGDQGEAFADVDVADLARDVISEARRRGADIELREWILTPGRTEISLRPQAIKRCLHNLIENAVAYGERATLSLTVARRFVEFAVEDDGPGIPRERREEAFRPFNRLDEARNLDNSSGVGLGLALALDTVRGHGGDLSLDESAELGGLRAVAVLPR